MKKKCNFCQNAIKKLRLGFILTLYILFASIVGTIEIINFIFK